MENDDMGYFMENGTFTLSLDTELIWGVVHWARKEHEQSVLKAREIISELLELMDKYHIPATWAVVGHLFLDKCEIRGGRKHADMPRPNYSWLKEDWYDVDPATNLKADPLFYGKDIVEKIISTKTKHEIGCHGFSHIIFDERGCSAEVADAELKKCRQLAQSFGITLSSMVFPQNSIGHLKILKENGFKCYRGPEPLWYEKYPKLVRKAVHPIDVALAVKPPVVEPIQALPGLWNIPGSMLYLSCDGIRGMVPVSARVAKAKKGIDLALQEKKIFHLWFHPFNIASNMQQMLAGIEEIFSYAERKKSEGLEIKTMLGIVGGIR